MQREGATTVALHLLQDRRPPGRTAGAGTPAATTSSLLPDQGHVCIVGGIGYARFTSTEVRRAGTYLPSQRVRSVSSGRFRMGFDESYASPLTGEERFPNPDLTTGTGASRTKEALRRSEARYQALIEGQGYLVCRFL